MHFYLAHRWPGVGRIARDAFRSKRHLGFSGLRRWYQLAQKGIQSLWANTPTGGWQHDNGLKCVLGDSIGSLACTEGRPTSTLCKAFSEICHGTLDSSSILLSDGTFRTFPFATVCFCRDFLTHFCIEIFSIFSLQVLSQASDVAGHLDRKVRESQRCESRTNRHIRRPVRCLSLWRWSLERWLPTSIPSHSVWGRGELPDNRRNEEEWPVELLHFRQICRLEDIRRY